MQSNVTVLPPTQQVLAGKSMLQLCDDSICELCGGASAAYVYRFDIRRSSVDDGHDGLAYPAKGHCHAALVLILNMH